MGHDSPLWKTHVHEVLASGIVRHLHVLNRPLKGLCQGGGLLFHCVQRSDNIVRLVAVSCWFSEDSGRNVSTVADGDAGRLLLGVAGAVELARGLDGLGLPAVWTAGTISDQIVG